jgi:hypothetical protein
MAYERGRRYARGMTDTSRTSSERIDAALREERDRLVVALRGLADKIETLPLERVSTGIAWVMTAAESLVKTVERSLNRDRAPS